MKSILTDDERQELFERNSGYGRDDFDSVIKATEAAVLEKLAAQEPEPDGHFLDTAYPGTTAEVYVYEHFRKGQQFYTSPLPATVQVPQEERAALTSPEAPAQTEDIRDAETELNCAEEILDSYAANLDLKETSFDCIGDYITAICEALKGKQCQDG